MLSSKNGLTLIEMMIVFIAIGILAAIAVPNFQSRATRAKEAAVKVNAHAVQQVVEDWAICNNGAYPGPDDISSGLFPGGVFPENPFTSAACTIAALGFSQGNIGYMMTPGTYVVEGYGESTMVISLTNDKSSRVD